MRSTGICRKIDELGRVVIPKEIRKTFKIKEGTPLEVFTDRESIILKKYNPIKDIDEFGKDIVYAIGIICDCKVALTDTVRVVASTEKIDTLITEDLREIIEVKEIYVSDNNKLPIRITCDDLNPKFQFIRPISDYGALIIYGKNHIGQKEIAVVESYVIFIEKQFTF